MLRNMSREEHFSGGGQTSPSLASLSPSLRHGNQDSSWISSISRPALSFLQKYLPGRSQTTPARADGLSGWVSGDFKQNLGLVDGESAFFGQLDGIMPATQQSPRHHLAYLHCQHETSVGSVGSGAPGSTSTLSWLTADSLRELGIENAAEIDLNIRQQTPVGYLATARSFLNHVLLNSASAQEIRTTEQMHHVLGGDGWPSDAVTAARAKSNGAGNWWAGFWGTEEHRAQGWLSNLSWSKEETGVSDARRHSGDHCPPLESGTKATVAMPTELFVQCSDEESMESESPGPSGHKEEATDNYGLTLTPRPESLPSSEELPFDQRPCIITDSRHLSAGAVTACSEVAVLTPDQDNGYSSLEEEHSACRLFMLKPPFENLQGPTEIPGDTITPGCSGEREPEREEASEKGEEGEAATGEMEEEEEEEAEEEEEEEMDDSDLTDSEEDEEEETVTMGTQSPAATPRCQNKAIAYIMGSPCSDDSQSDDELSEDDDGFDSEGSSELSDSDDDDDDNEDEEEEEEEESDSDQADPETERLWNSLCQSRDPYNPQNFTASIHSAPRTAPDPPCRAATTSSHQHASPPSHQPSASPLLSSSSSSPSPLLEEDNNDFGDESTASEADEAESLRLWNSFSASSDPYSPMNFQAPLRTTQEATPGPAGRRSRKARTRHGSSPPQYRTEEAEERLDSGFSESLPVPVTTTTTTSWVTVKKVCFCEDVEEFYASGDEEEDRRGPWEELARDRCRFLRRVQEVEDAIAYVLVPAFRRGVLHKLQHCS